MSGVEPSKKDWDVLKRIPPGSLFSKTSLRLVASLCRVVKHVRNFAVLLQNQETIHTYELFWGRSKSPLFLDQNCFVTIAGGPGQKPDSASVLTLPGEQKNEAGHAKETAKAPFYLPNCSKNQNIL